MQTILKSLICSMVWVLNMTAVRPGPILDSSTHAPSDFHMDDWFPCASWVSKVAMLFSLNRKPHYSC